MAATMADVAASAGVSQGLPYRYFSDKDDLIRALVTEAVRQADAEGSPLELPGSAAGRCACSSPAWPRRGGSSRSCSC